MARQSEESATREPLVRCERLEPIRTVKRELIQPDGTKVMVDGPVYPPFKLEERVVPPAPTRPRKKAGPKRSSEAA